MILNANMANIKLLFGLKKLSGLSRNGPQPPVGLLAQQIKGTL